MELQDLQRAVDELTEENESLAFKNSRLLEALCDQTLKLDNYRTQINHLKVGRRVHSTRPPLPPHTHGVAPLNHLAGAVACAP